MNLTLFCPRLCGLRPSGCRFVISLWPGSTRNVVTLKNNITTRQLHTSGVVGCIKSPSEDEDKNQSAVITRGYFDRGKEEQNKENFEGAIDIFTHKDSRRRGSVEFIYAAMKNMEHFGVHRDLGSYKKLMEVFPKGKTSI